MTRRSASAPIPVHRGASGRLAPSFLLGGVGGVLAADFAPGLAAIGPLRRRLLPALAGAGRSDHVALTFDDGPDPASTPQFLEALDRLGWRATFFMLGTMARRAPSLVAEVAAAGHEVALHGEEHRSHLLRSPRAVVDDLARGAAVLGELTGIAPRWHRPPYGGLSGGTLLAARRLGLTVVLWGAWGRDWRAEATPGSVLADLSRSLVGGTTVLLHDSDCTSAPGAWKSALGALPLLADHVAAHGWSVGTLADHGLRPPDTPDALAAEPRRARPLRP